MSISSALSNALSGLVVSSRAADAVSSNIANAMTDGYGVREVNIASRVIGNSGAGARVAGVTRHEDPVLIAHRRHADADLGALQTQAGFLSRLEYLIGTPDQSGSLSARAAEFEARLIAAANGPHLQANLVAGVEAAKALVGQINTISDGIQAERLQADTDIARHVDKINGTLVQLAELNTRIRQGAGGGRDVSALLDAQAKLVDDIAPLAPLQTRRDATGALQVYSQDGEALLDGRPATLGFAAVSVMKADMSYEDGTLSGLTLNGRALALSGKTPVLGGGELAALFALRDRDAVEAQAAIDGVARDLAQRFDQSGLDPTRSAATLGLFTDAGAAVTPLTEVGLAGRLRVNSVVVPEAAGQVWRLRDGMGASAEGPAGNNSFLIAQVGALSELLTTASGGFSAASRSFSGLVSDHVTQTGLQRQRVETDQTHTAMRQSALRQDELSQGVDTDAEMQTLLLIERAFAANARVIQSAEEMMDALMRIGR